MESLRNMVEEQIQKVHGEVGLGFKNLKNGEQFYFNGSKRFLSASTFKIPVLVELYKQVLSSRLSLQERYTMHKSDVIFGSGVLKELEPGLALTLKDYAMLMMMISDNTATDIVTNIVGKDNVNKTMDKLGLCDTRVMMTCKELLYDAIGLKATDSDEERQNKLSRGKLDKTSRAFTDFDDNDVSTPENMVSLLSKIYHREILDDFACKEIIAIMNKCQTNERIPRMLPPSVKVAHKTGTLGGNVNDVGIVQTPVGDYILAVYFRGELEEGARQCQEGVDFIAHLSHKIYSHIVKTSE